MTVDLNTEIIGLTHMDDVDVVILDTAPPPPAFEVFSTGRLLYGEHEDRVEYEVESNKRFIDTAPMRRLQQQAFLARIDSLADTLGEGKDRSMPSPCTGITGRTDAPSRAGPMTSMCRPAPARARGARR